MSLKTSAVMALVLTMLPIVTWAQDAKGLLVDKQLPFELTIDDLVALEPADLKRTGGKNSRLKMAEQAFRKAKAAGIRFVFGSGATSADTARQAGRRRSDCGLGRAAHRHQRDAARALCDEGRVSL